MPLAATAPTPLARVARAPSASYVRRAPELTTLHRIMRAHVATFLERARERGDGRGVPAFVERAFMRFLDCGALQRGFCRLRCKACGFDHLVALSCKGRGFCPSCGGKRMTELAAYLVDHMIPFVPVRQLVLSLPPRLRYLLAYDHSRCTAVLRIFARAVRAFYRRRAAARGDVDGHTGSVTFIQRFGSAANLNLHLHLLALDGVFTERPDGTLCFHATAPPTTEEITTLIATVRVCVERWLEREGLADDVALDTLADDAPLLAHAYATSIAGQSAFERPFAPIRRLGRTEARQRSYLPAALHVHDEGFDLHAGLCIASQHETGREPLEKLLRYCARPPLADDRLEQRPDGRIVLQLKTAWHDGTTHLELDPLDFLARCAALVPRPHKNLVIYHGVLAAHARLRERAVAYGRPPESARPAHCPLDASRVASIAHIAVTQPDASTCASLLPPPTSSTLAAPPSSRRRGLWADLMRRAFGYDLRACPRCGGEMELLACILEAATIRRILAHLDLPTEREPLAPARASPNADLWSDEVA